MARANDNGWDFVKEGHIYQYQEDGMVGMVKIESVKSDDEFYSFDVHVLASDGRLPVDSRFNVTHSKNPGGYWSGMSQFYESPEYVPLPIGKPWPVSIPGHEHEGIQYSPRKERHEPT